MRIYVSKTISDFVAAVQKLAGIFIRGEAETQVRPYASVALASNRLRYFSLLNPISLWSKSGSVPISSISYMDY